MVIKNIGQDKWDALERESNRTEKVDLEEVKKYLEGIEAELKEKNDEKEREPSDRNLLDA